MLFAGGGTYNKDTHLCGILSFGVDCLISSTHFGDGSAYNFDMLIAGGSIAASLTGGIFTFYVASLPSWFTWDFGSAKKYHI